MIREHLALGSLPRSRRPACGPALAGADADPLGAAASGGGQPASTAVPTVLVIEPAADELQRVVAGLSAHGYRAIPVEDGHTALDWAEIFRPQVIVLSSTLPDFKGHEILSWLQQSPWMGVAGVILVASDDEPVSPEDRARATAVLRRPIQLAELLALLRHEGFVAQTTA